jgi:hypothetical protein
LSLVVAVAVQVALAAAAAVVAVIGQMSAAKTAVVVRRLNLLWALAMVSRTKSQSVRVVPERHLQRVMASQATIQPSAPLRLRVVVLVLTVPTTAVAADLAVAQAAITQATRLGLVALAQPTKAMRVEIA